MSDFNEANEYASQAVWGVSYLEDDKRTPNPDGTVLDVILSFHREDDVCFVDLRGKTVSHQLWAETATEIEGLLRHGWDRFAELDPQAAKIADSLMKQRETITDLYGVARQ